MVTAYTEQASAAPVPRTVAATMTSTTAMAAATNAEYQWIQPRARGRVSARLATAEVMSPSCPNRPAASP